LDVLLLVPEVVVQSQIDLVAHDCQASLLDGGPPHQARTHRRLGVAPFHHRALIASIGHSKRILILLAEVSRLVLCWLLSEL